jgi:hypothetical protein
MERIENNVSFYAELIKNNLVRKTNTSGVETIYGNLICRASDGTEQPINVYCEEVRSRWVNGVKEYTNEENKVFKGLSTVATYQGKDVNPNETIILHSNSANLKCNDYVNNKGDLSNILQISANFITSNKALSKNEDLSFKFTVNGIIENMKKEFDKNDQPTGNLLIDFLVLTTKGGWGYNSVAELNSCFPMELLVPQNLAEAFTKAGYYEGCYATLSGNMVNTKTETKEVEKMAFGEDNVKIVTSYKRANEVTSGKSPKALNEIGITKAQIDALKNKRDVALKQLLNEGYKGSKTSTASTTQANPFGNNSTTEAVNPFGGSEMAFNPFVS